MGKGAYRRAAAGVNERFAHELAHQWWGYGVRMPSLDEQWLSESFAEWCSAFFIRQAAGREAYDLYLTLWRTRAGEARDSAPILHAHRLRAKNDQLQAERLRTDLLYGKGPLVLAAIHGRSATRRSSRSSPPSRRHSAGRPARRGRSRRSSRP